MRRPESTPKPHIASKGFSDMYRDDSNSAAALKVFQIPELCEMILLYLKPRDRLHAKIAHEFISQTIMGNSRLRKSLFLEADHTPRERNIRLDHNSFRLNLFLRSALAQRGWTFELDTHSQNYVRLKMSAISDGEWKQQCNNVRYPIAHIKDMLESQPPKTVLLDFDTKPYLFVHHETTDVPGGHCTIGWIFSRVEEIEEVKVLSDE